MDHLRGRPGSGWQTLLGLAGLVLGLTASPAVHAGPRWWGGLVGRVSRALVGPQTPVERKQTGQIIDPQRYRTLSDIQFAIENCVIALNRTQFLELQDGTTSLPYASPKRKALEDTRWGINYLLGNATKLGGPKVPLDLTRASIQDSIKNIDEFIQTELERPLPWSWDTVARKQQLRDYRKR